MITFDHIAISGETLEEARSFVEDALGVHLQPGGAHDVFFTHNALLGLEDGLYLEAIAANPKAPTPKRPRWFGLDRFTGPPRLTNWICRTDDLELALEAAPKGLGRPVGLSRGDLRWRMAVPQSGELPFNNCAPALIQWQTNTHPATLLRQSGVRLVKLTICHPKADDLNQHLSGIFSDRRVTFQKGPAGLSAEFKTPHGKRTIGQ